MRLLLVEDEKRMAEALAEILRKENYTVDVFNDGEEGLYAVTSEVYDIIILDVMLPNMSGFEIAKRARANNIKTPILMLTAKSEIDDKVEGLDSGADDYLTKPFVTKELLARIRALLRRYAGASDNDRLEFGDLSLNLESCMLSCSTSGQSVRLREKEFKIMQYLLANQGQIFEREKLAVKIWDFDSNAEYNNVEVYISFTRKKLAFIESKVEIKSVRGIGYELRYNKD
ncbi:MAG: response regulator transcription factor [Ruminococcus sp.]|jgi:DNA-binding response OmpR family regulator|nr:response regulator transcription factor [Ruminococcus sp.]